MKKFLTLVLALVLSLGAFVGCGSSESQSENVELLNKNNNVRVEQNESFEDVDIPDDFKIGLITLHDSASTYDKNFIDAFKEATSAMGLKEDQIMIETGIPESTECYNAAKKLANSGCKVIFADSFGHEDFIIQAAKEFKNVQFCHATGTKAHTEGLENFHNAFASIYEGRFLAGVAAGMKLKEMSANGKLTDKNYDDNHNVKVGYVGAFTYAEVVSGYTSWFLGVKTVLNEANIGVSMEVSFTGSWYDETAEKNAATTLINNGAALVSQHADSMGAPTACETAGVPNVSYNGSTESACPNTFIVSSRINWAPYFKYIIKQGATGQAIVTDWCGTIGTESVLLTEVGAAAAEGTQAEIDKYKAMILDGTLNVFDTAKDNYITVDGKKLTSAAADIDSDDAFVKETEAIVGGCYKESVYRSAPSFDLTIDGILLLNSKF